MGDLGTDRALNLKRMSLRMKQLEVQSLQLEVREMEMMTDLNALQNQKASCQKEMDDLKLKQQELEKEVKLSENKNPDVKTAGAKQ